MHLCTLLGLWGRGGALQELKGARLVPDSWGCGTEHECNTAPVQSKCAARQASAIGQGVRERTRACAELLQSHDDLWLGILGGFSQPHVTLVHGRPGLGW